MVRREGVRLATKLIDQRVEIESVIKWRRRRQGAIGPIASDMAIIRRRWVVDLHWAWAGGAQLEIALIPVRVFLMSAQSAPPHPLLTSATPPARRSSASPNAYRKTKEAVEAVHIPSSKSFS